VLSVIHHANRDIMEMDQYAGKIAQLVSSLVVLSALIVKINVLAV